MAPRSSKRPSAEQARRIATTSACAVGSFAEVTWFQPSANDPTAHAEVVAIRRACAALGRFELRGATLYTSCEPCPMCLAAAYWARLDAVIYANAREEAAERHIGHGSQLV